MGTQRSVQAPVWQVPGLFPQSIATNLQTVFVQVQSLFGVFLNPSCQLALLGMSSTCQLIVYLLLIFN